MKHYNLLLSISGLLVIVCVVMRITHVPGAYYIIVWALIGGIFIQNIHIKKLTKRIDDLEKRI